jgi:hypothetical protein
MARSVITGDQDLGTVEFDQLSGTGSVDVSDILDQDGFTNNSADALATQQSIKAYVDANAPGVSIQYAKAFLSSAVFSTNTTYTQQNIFPVTASLTLNEGSFTSTTAGIAVPATGLYLCSFNIQADRPDNGSRASCNVRLSVDGTGINETSSCGYGRGRQGSTFSFVLSYHLSTILSLTAGQRVGIQARDQMSSGSNRTVTTRTTSDLTLYRVI